MKSCSRGASFWIIAGVYVLAAVVGIAVYLWLPYSWQLNLLIADVAATVVTFFFSVVFKNASVYDPYWSVQPIIIVLAFALDVSGAMVLMCRRSGQHGAVPDGQHPHGRQPPSCEARLCAVQKANKDASADAEKPSLQWQRA